MSKKRKKIRVKKKKRKYLLIVFIILITIITTLSVLIVNEHNKKVFKEIKSNYNEYVITTNKATLYNKNYKKTGTISKDFSLQLSKYQIKDNSIKYFKIKGTNYYINYKDITKDKKQLKKESNNYLVFNKNINTKNKIDLYKNDKIALSLDNGLNVPILYMDKDNYYVNYLNQLLKVKKSKNIKEIDHINTKEKEAEFISVLYYENIEETCSNYNCITKDQASGELKKLLESGYYTITMDQYNNYLDKYIRLKDKAILITTKSTNDITNNISKELKINIEKIDDKSPIKLNLTNKKSTKDSKKDSIEAYQIKSYSTIDNIIKMAQGEEVIEAEPVKVTNQGIAVINYHFFYDEGSEACNEEICLSTQKFREELDYLKQNNYKTLTMKEFKQWMYGQIELPEKSVLLTIDDGAFGTGKHNGNHLIPILEEYKMHATLFLIAGWWDINNYRSPYLDIQSHTFDMHNRGTCGDPQLLCATYDEVKVDLQKSLDIIKNDDSFCYPFYSYDNEAIQAIKDLGFKLAFAGGNRKATRSSNKYLIPRYPIYKSTTLNQFINMVS